MRCSHQSKARLLRAMAGGELEAPICGSVGTELVQVDHRQIHLKDRR